MKRKLIIIILIFTITFINLNCCAYIYAAPLDNIPPTVTIYYAGNQAVKLGESIVYNITYLDNTKVESIKLKNSDISLNGFTANIDIQANQNKRKIILSNIQGEIGVNKYISLKPGTAVDISGNVAKGVDRSAYFRIVDSKDSKNPDIYLSGPSDKTVHMGESITYTAKYSDNIGIEKINLTSKNIILNGFEANINVYGSGMERKIKLSNISGEYDQDKSITISSGTAVDAAGNKAYGISMSQKFSIVEKQTDFNGKIINIPVEESILTSIEDQESFECTDPVTLEIDNKVKKAGMWFDVTRDNVKNFYENNYISEGKTCTYNIQFYNNTDENLENVLIRLSIPKSVDVVEVTAGGEKVSKTNQLTVVQWKVGKLEKGKGYTLKAKVKFLEDTNLKKSKELVSEFFSKVDMISDKQINSMYTRQAFVDLSKNKSAKSKKYLKIYTFPSKISPSEKISKVDFARIIIDSGIIKNIPSKKGYKSYNDKNKIPFNQRKAVSTMTEIGIFMPDEKGNLNADKLITKAEMYDILMKVLKYKYNDLLVSEATPFIVNKDITNNENEALEYKNSVMQLIRMNIVERSSINISETATIQDVLQVVNCVTYRDNIGKIKNINNTKFAKENLDLITIATKNIKYKYDKDLKMQVV
ncbi:MAG: hypothetical protein RR922_01815 [Clostridia bacterium]